MTHYAAFHQGLHCLLKQKQSSEKEMQFVCFSKIITCDPSIYTMDHPAFIVSSFIENSIGLKWINPMAFSKAKSD